MTLKMNKYVSCIKIFGVPIVSPLMTDEKRLEMKEYKEKAIAYEHKLRGKRVSLDSGVMTASTEMQKLENYESPTSVVKESFYCGLNNTYKIATQNIIKVDSSISSETPTLLVSEEEEHMNDCSSDKESINIKSENVSLIENPCDTLISKEEPTSHLTVINSTIHNIDNLNVNICKQESVTNKSENDCGIKIPKQDKTHILTATNETIYDEDNKNTFAEQKPRLRSNSYTLSSPSPVMVAFLNSRVQQQLIEPKSLDSNISHNKESKSEPSSIFVASECDVKIQKSRSISLRSVSQEFHNQNLMNNLLKYKNQSVINEQIDNKIKSDQKRGDSGSVTTIETNFSPDESVVGSVITVFNGNSFENNSSPSSVTCSKSIKHCCCRHSDDEFSLSSNNFHYRTPEELNQEAERLRMAKLDIEKRHQEELSNLIRKQREEQEQIAVRYYLVTQSSSGMSLDDSEYSESLSKKLKTLSIHSGTTVTNDKSILSDTSSITSSCSINKNMVCSSPRQRTPSRSPSLQQNIKFYHRIRGNMTSKWTKAPTEVENSAATIINAGVRGYLTRRLLRTEKAQLLKKTILDSLKTALIMHMELKKQQPTESDLELHRRIINQLTTACYDLNDLILGSIHEQMTVIRGDRERLKAVKMRRKSSSALINKPSTLRQPKKSTSGYSLSKKASSIYSDKSSYTKH